MDQENGNDKEEEVVKRQPQKPHIEPRENEIAHIVRAYLSSLPPPHGAATATLILETANTRQYGTVKYLTNLYKPRKLIPVLDTTGWFKIDNYRIELKPEFIDQQP